MTLSRQIASVDADNKITHIAILRVEDVTESMIDVTDMNVGVGWVYEENKWIPPKPDGNWVLNETSDEWIPPIPKPETLPKGGWYWHEEDNEWVDMIPIVLEKTEVK
jgi:hypothetical protein